MLVIISDLHLNDGSTGIDPNPEAFQSFIQRLNEQAFQASWRANGRYRPLDRIDLVLLGDVLDLTASTRWLRSSARPWSDLNEPSTVEVISDIVEATLRQNAHGLALLREVSMGAAIGLPPVNSLGQPVPSSELQSPRIDVHYMVGNRDWMLHHTGSHYELLRRRIAQQMALDSPTDQPFPHDSSECPLLQQALRRHRVVARHGDCFDPLSYPGHRDESSLSDALVVGLILPFLADVDRDLAEILPAGAVVQLREMQHVRPLWLAAQWIQSVTRCHSLPPIVQRKIEQLWNERVHQVMELELVRQQDREIPGGIVDALATELLMRRWSDAKPLAAAILNLGGAEDLVKQAQAEADVRNRRARHVVYGHSHQAAVVPLEASHADGVTLNQVYLNTGCWQRVQRPSVASDSSEFVPIDQLGSVTFYQGDERGGRPFETYQTWTGVQISTPSYRMDSARPQAVSPPNWPTSNEPAPSGPQSQPLARPHFSTRPSTVRQD